MLKGTKNGIVIDIKNLEDLLSLSDKIKSKSYFYKDTKFIMNSSSSYFKDVLKILEDEGYSLDSSAYVPLELENEIKSSEETSVIKKTLRSGQRIEFNGNIVILGNVNPGAEVIASGDIYVFGKAMGLLHAGSRGDKSKIIVAMKLDVIQIRIANIYAKYEGKFEDRNLVKAEKGFLDENYNLVIEEYKPFD